MKTKLYTLQDENGNIRYIGKTVKPLDIRLNGHLWEAKSGIQNRKNNWIRYMLSRGVKPIIELLAEINDDGCKLEIAYIKLYREKGVDLVNTTDGGDGMVGVKASPETRKKLSEAKKGRKRPPFSEETRKKISENSTAMWKRPEYYNKMSVLNKGRIHSEEVKRKYREAAIKRFSSLEARTQHSKNLKGRKFPKKWKENISKALKGRIFTLEDRKKLSDGAKRYYQNKKKEKDDGQAYLF